MAEHFKSPRKYQYSNDNKILVIHIKYQVPQLKTILKGPCFSMPVFREITTERTLDDSMHHTV